MANKRKRRRSPTPEEMAEREAILRWDGWVDFFRQAMQALLEHHPDSPQLVDRAAHIADQALERIEARSPKRFNGRQEA
jgi:hypothetical protein